MEVTAKRRIVVWTFMDGRTGHHKQIEGLVQGLEQYVDLDRISINVTNDQSNPGEHSWGISVMRQLPKPNLLVGAGHASHLPIILARLLRGGKSVVLMRPTVPCSWFDMVLIPEHDRSGSLASVVFTRGVLCPTRTATKKKQSGLILLGGTSRHFKWPLHAITDHVDGILRASPQVNWAVCDSRRTPETTLSLIHSRFGLPVYRHHEESITFLAERLAEATYVWVSADSVSMLHEAVASGARVGVLMLPPNETAGKVLRGIEQLARRNQIGLSSDGYVLDRVVPTPQTRPENIQAAERVVRDLLSGH